MMSPSLRFRSCARRALTHAVGSHVTFVSGFGSSWSHPLLAKRPSQMVGSGLKMISRPPLAAVAGAEVEGWVLEVGVGATPPAVALAADPAGFPASIPRPPASAPLVPGTQPSCSTWFQKLSGLLNLWPAGSVIDQPATWPP